MNCIKNSFILKGDICFCPDPEHIVFHKSSYLICLDGKSAGIFSQIPTQYQPLPLQDCSGMLIIPGMTDLHVHAPQYTFRGLGMDLELLEWLNTHTFPEESRYEDLSYADRAYRIFVRDLKSGPATRACIFATRHVPATLHLMKLLEESGLITFVGKVNMDRNSPDPLCEADADSSLSDTRLWLDQCSIFHRCRPILTPRFIPSCSDELMYGLSEIQKETGLPVQSHLSENPSEVNWVKELCPESSCYADAYASRGLLGSKTSPAIMAHCVYSSEDELKILHKYSAFIAHCPESNANLSSGIAPVRRFLQLGIPVGLGSDVAGGTSCSLFHAMAMAIQCSKLRWRMLDSSLAPLTVSEVFWMASAGGGAFFGKTGSFENGYDFDALVINDCRFQTLLRLTPAERLERLIYLGEDQDIIHKFTAGEKLW